MPKLDNPVTVEYLQANLVAEQPRLGMTPAIEADIRDRLASDPVLGNVYQAMKLNAEKILDEPLLDPGTDWSAAARHVTGDALADQHSGFYLPDGKVP